MYFSCWRLIIYPKLNQSHASLKALDGHGFQPHRILQSFAVTLKGKIVSIDIEVVDMHLDYNLLLGRSWFYVITFVSYSMFHILQFPHHGKIVTIDQLDYFIPNLHDYAAKNVPFLGFSLGYESVGVVLLNDSSLMVIFPLHPPDTP
jgi:hypothetical protein